MADDLPPIIVLALGGAAAGGPDALRLLVGVAGWNPATDVLLVVFLICAVTALVFGTMLLARYVRVVDANDGAARLHPVGTARFARVTLAVGLAVVVFVAACLLAVPPGPAGVGGAGSTCSA